MVDKAIAFLSSAKKDGHSRVVCVCGLSGSGKSTLCKQLCEHFSDATTVSADDFLFVPTAIRKSYLQTALDTQNWERLSYLANPTNPADNPYANPASWYDWNGLADCLRALKSGNMATRINAWDQQTGLCDKTITYLPSAPNGFVFLDCVYPFESEIEPLIDFRILLDISPETANTRAANRDSHRSDALYLRYKELVSNLYDTPHSTKNKQRMDLVLTV